MEQSLMWLRNKMAEKDTLDAVNAEICYNTLMDIRKSRDRIGAIYQRTRNTSEPEGDKPEKVLYMEAWQDGYSAGFEDGKETL